MRQDNIFKVGPVVDGESLIGYDTISLNLKRNILDDKGNLSLVGVHRMGKTSLIKKLHREAATRDKIIEIFINLREFVSEDNVPFNALLENIIYSLKKKLRTKIDLESDSCINLRSDFHDFESVPKGGKTFRDTFKEIFKELKNLGFHVLLSFDEFDTAEEIFATQADYELFRTLANSEYAVSLIFISRRRLYMIEKKNETNSVFSAAFPKEAISGLTKDDAALFIENLKSQYDIELSEHQKKRIDYYAGRSPYIYSEFCHRLVERKLNGQNDFDIDEIYKKYSASTVIEYADVLFSRLEHDNHVAKLAEILFGPRMNVTRQDVDMFYWMGYLSEQTDNFGNYEALSGYWTDFFRNKHFVDDSWKNIISLEKLMKLIVSESLNLDDDADLQEIMENVYQKFEEKSFQSSLYKNFIANNFNVYGVKSTMLDVMSLKDTFLIIEFFWDKVFKKYFGDDNLEKWHVKFELCGRARNPLAHGHEEYLTEPQRVQVNSFCVEISDTVNKNRSQTNKEKITVSTPKELPIKSDVPAESFIGQIGTLTNISLNKKGRGIKGKILGCSGTVSKSYLPKEPDFYLNKTLQVVIIDLNSQKDGYLLKPVAD